MSIPTRICHSGEPERAEVFFYFWLPVSVLIIAPLVVVSGFFIARLFIWILK